MLEPCCEDRKGENGYSNGAWFGMSKVAPDLVLLTISKEPDPNDNVHIPIRFCPMCGARLSDSELAKTLASTRQERDPR